MAMCLMQALIEGKSPIDQKKIADWYLKWYEDGPFDIGMTTRNAMESIKYMSVKGLIIEA
jgi:ADP-ribosylglycohydrolase